MAQDFIPLVFVLFTGILCSCLLTVLSVLYICISLCVMQMHGVRERLTYLNFLYFAFICIR